MGTALIRLRKKVSILQEMSKRGMLSDFEIEFLKEKEILKKDKNL